MTTGEGHRLETGLQYYLLPITLIQAKADYHFLFESSNTTEENLDDGAWADTFGIDLNS